MTHKEKALDYFGRRFHCSQAVLAAFAKECDLTEKQALSLGACFGSGMRKGEVCGACTGALLVLGAMYGQYDKADEKSGLVSDEINDKRKRSLKMQKANNLNYITFGKGKKNLIMIQGLNTRDIKGSGPMLSFMYGIFKKEYKVYLFDRRPDVPEGITVSDMAEDIAGAMDELGITKADVFGVSQGGMTAQNLAIKRPDLVNKLVLAVTLSKNNDMVCQVIENWITLVEQNKMREFVENMAYRSYSEEYVKRYKLFMPLLTVFQKPKDTERFIRLAKACLTCNTYEELDKIQCPVYVIGGEQDKIVGGAASKEIAEKLNCELYMYEDLGHAAYEEAADFNKRVYDFLIS